jgi:hypothetical protein
MTERRPYKIAHWTWRTIRHGNTSFLLQEFPEGIDNFMMHLLGPVLNYTIPKGLVA